MSCALKAIRERASFWTTNLPSAGWINSAEKLKRTELLAARNEGRAPAPASASRHSIWRRPGLQHAIHYPATVPDLYAGIAAGNEQNVCTRLRLGIGVALDHVGCRDAIGGIQLVTTIVWHAHIVSARGITPTSGARSTQANGC